MNPNLAWAHGALAWVHGGVPQLIGVHFPQTLVALNFHAAVAELLELFANLHQVAHPAAFLVVRNPEQWVLRYAAVVTGVELQPLQVGQIAFDAGVKPAGGSQ